MGFAFSTSKKLVRKYIFSTKKAKALKKYVDNAVEVGIIRILTTDNKPVNIIS